MLPNTKKHKKSLSHEQKVQDMAIDAAAHKKQYELLPPEKKARLMETRPEQRHEHLKEEEKKISTQIRSVAATLYTKDDLDKPTVEFLRENFYKDPTLALAYFYCCSTDLLHPFVRIRVINNQSLIMHNRWEWVIYNQRKRVPFSPLFLVFGGFLF